MEKKVTFRIGGMTCTNCQRRIENKLRRMNGVTTAAVSYAEGTATVTFDREVIAENGIAEAITALGYTVVPGRKSDAKRAVGLLIIILALYTLLSQFGILNLLVPSRLAETTMGYGMLFVVGLFTSVHCVAMCGGISLSQTVGKKGLRPTALYNLGRVISYTAVGFVVGALGSVISFAPAAQGVLKLIAGAFMVLMGANMLGLAPFLRKLTLRFPHSSKKSGKSPLVVGLLNGLMPCGPLQAMQIYALSTGNPWAGALSMLLFSLGTVPLMFGLGALSSAFGKNFSRRMAAAGAVLVVVLGLSMLSQGWSLSAPISSSESKTAESAAEAGSDVQVIRSTLQPGRYPAITVRAGTPVKWVIDAPKGSINGCNNALYIPEYDIEYSFKTGENIIEFTPADTGTFRYSCWMGMIRSTITVEAES